MQNFFAHNVEGSNRCACLALARIVSSILLFLYAIVDNASVHDVRRHRHNSGYIAPLVAYDRFAGCSAKTRGGVCTLDAPIMQAVLLLGRQGDAGGWLKVRGGRTNTGTVPGTPGFRSKPLGKGGLAPPQAGTTYLASMECDLIAQCWPFRSISFFGASMAMRNPATKDVPTVAGAVMGVYCCNSHCPYSFRHAVL